MGQGPRIKRAKWTKWSTGKKMCRGGVGERTKGNEGGEGSEGDE